MNYLAYNKEGKILWTESFSSDVFDPTKLGLPHNYMLVDDWDTPSDRFYIKDGKITDRPTMSLTIDKTFITANGTDKVTITGIPNSTTVTCGKQTTSITDGTLEFTTEVPGKYVLKFENFPYQEMEVEIDAT